MKKINFIFLLFCVILLTACGAEKEEKVKQEKLGDNQIYLYYVNSDKTDLVPVVYDINQDQVLKVKIAEIIKKLSKTEENEDYLSPIPKEITYKKNGIDKRYSKIDVTFQILYDSVEADTLMFFKSCVAKSLLQLDGVDTVTISLIDATGGLEEPIVESFDQDSFTLSFKSEEGYNQKGTVVLYFANEDGTALKEYRKTIELSNNMSLSRIVMELLIEGPEEEGYQATLSKNTKIQNISVKDGICYVDLSDEFYDTDNTLKNDIIVYSVINSLVELPTVSKVQFLRNGEKQEFFREGMPFDGIFERNLDLIEQEDITK